MLKAKRMDKDREGKIDDISVEGVKMFRAEKMERHPDGSETWWMRVYCSNGQDLVIRFTSTATPLFEIDE